MKCCWRHGLRSGVAALAPVIYKGFGDPLLVPSPKFKVIKWWL
jgi:hypothetical protein